MNVYTTPSYPAYDGEFRLFSNFEEAKAYTFYCLFSKVYECFPFVYEKDEIYSTEMTMVSGLRGTYAKILIKKHNKVITSRTARIGTIKVD